MSDKDKKDENKDDKKDEKKDDKKDNKDEEEELNCCQACWYGYCACVVWTVKVILLI